MLLRTALRTVSAWLIWRWLAPRWRSTLALAIGWLLLVMLHNEYVEYVGISGSSEWLWLSYVIKWLLLLAGISLYIWFALLGVRTTSSNAASPAARDDTKAAVPAADDGFDFLRNKAILASRGDLVIKQHERVSKDAAPD